MWEWQTYDSASSVRSILKARLRGSCPATALIHHLFSVGAKNAMKIPVREVNGCDLLSMSVVEATVVLRLTMAGGLIHKIEELLITITSVSSLRTAPMSPIDMTTCQI